MDTYGMQGYGEGKSTPSPVKAVEKKKGFAEQAERSLGDAEQSIKYEQIIELLLAAGYFRARISSLSAFDKVVGGLAWCISNSQVDVDIDLLFQENANIGLQIKLGEAIEKALLRMKCPFPLLSHQIRGLDYISIFPVTQWLVKRVIEVREETGDLLRVFSEWHFGKRYKLPSDRDFETRKEPAVGYMKSVAYRYRPSRLYKRKDLLVDEPEEDRVQSTLLEFGHKAYRAVAQAGDKKKLSEKQKAVDKALGGKGDQSAEAKAAEERRFANMLKGMEQAEESDGVSGNMLRDLVGQQSEHIRRLDEERGERLPGDLDGAKSGKAYEEEAHKRHVQNLEGKILALKGKLKEAAGPYRELQGQLQELEQRLEEKAGRNRQIEEEMERFQQMITPENSQDVETLRSLVYLNENLKRQEELFRANCRRQLQSFKEKMQELKSMPVDEGDSERLVMIKQTHSKDSERLVKHRQALNKKIRDIALVERKLDEIPSRSELQQYQQQFMELYEQVASKLTETRKYYQTYNTLDDSRALLAKEISILNSIHENYGAAMKSEKLKEKLLEQIKNILTGVDQNLQKKSATLQDEKQKLHVINEKYLQLLERERAYHKAAKDFELECAKNEKLLQAINAN